MDKNYPLFDIFWDEKDVENISKVIKRGSYWAGGPEIKEFEEKLSNYLKSKYVVTFNSGTSALHSILLAYGITAGEVIVPSFSFISTANSVILAGARPVFAEIEEESLGLDLEDVKERISKNTRAIIPVHYAGRPCKYIEELKEIADDYKLKLIEDNAEGFGAKINNKYTGTIGHSNMLSFCQNKIITTGEGGAICTNEVDIYNKLLLIRSHGRVEQPNSDYFSNIYEMEYIDIGYNFRMPTICAALGISQLEKIDEILKLRRERGEFYNENLKEINEIQVLPKIENTRIVYQLYSILLRNPNIKSELQEFLLNKGIYTKTYFPPIHLKTFYRRKYGYKEGNLPRTEELSKKILTLPLSLRFTDQEQLFIVKTIKDFF